MAHVSANSATARLEDMSDAPPANRYRSQAPHPKMSGGDKKALSTVAASIHQAIVLERVVLMASTRLASSLRAQKRAEVEVAVVLKLWCSLRGFARRRTLHRRRWRPGPVQNLYILHARIWLDGCSALHFNDRKVTMI